MPAESTPVLARYPARESEEAFITAPDDGARYDDCLDRFHVGVVDEDFVTLHEQGTFERTRRRLLRMRPSDGGKIAKAISANAHSFGNQDFTTPRAAGEEHGNGMPK